MAAAAHAGGTVPLGDRALFVRVLSVQQERTLWNEIGRRVRAAYGPGGLFQKMAPRLDWLREQKRHAEYAEVVRHLTTMEANEEPPGVAALDLYRATPDGVALELFYRTRDSEPKATEKEFRAVVNETNAAEVHLAILAALDPGEPGNG